jgi:hypothetical protein
MRGICLLSLVTPLVMQYVATDDSCKVKSVYSISMHFSKFGFRFILATLNKVLDKGQRLPVDLQRRQTELRI